jgi:hypothetical protein
MRFVFRPVGVEMSRVLVVESGPRPVAERFLAHLYASHPAQRVDLLTCVEGEAAGLQLDRGSVTNVHLYRGFTARRELIRNFARAGYGVVAIFCTGHNIMTRWKWAVALRVPAKVLIVNENGDYFWLDSGNFANMLAMLKHRLNWRVAASPRLFFELLTSPLVLLYLLAYAGWIHSRRVLRHLLHGNA